MSRFIALIHKEPKSDFGVSFPDLPGCTSAGRTLDEARASAAEALALHLEGMTEDGIELPKPTSLDLIMKDRANRDAVAFLVEAAAPRTHSVRVNITLPSDVLQSIDAFAEVEGLTRSGFLARAARRELDKRA